MILVLGNGITGGAVAAHLRGRGETVLVVDDAGPEPDGLEDHETEVEAVVDTATGLRALDEVTMLVPSPGVRPSHPLVVAARERSIPVRSEIELAAARSAARIVAITGTNGKSTVTTLVTGMLCASGLEAVAAGNIGRALVDVVDDADGGPHDVIVVEVSSFQLATSEAFRPAVAVLLNVAEDHLDWHGSFAAYAAAKARIFAHQDEHDVLVHPAQDPVVAELVAPGRARRITFATHGPASYRVEGTDLVDDDDQVLAGLDVLAPGVEPANALAAAAAARSAGASTAGIRAALGEVTSLPHRVAPVGDAGGVRWVDDSKATNPHAAAHAIARFDRVVLLAGGRNKGLDLAGLRDHEDRLRAVVAIGESAGEIEGVFASSAVPVRRADSMRAAVRTAAALARPGDTVLLSPACASFDWYAGYAERGDDFVAEVQALLGRAPSGDPA